MNNVHYISTPFCEGKGQTIPGKNMPPKPSKTKKKPLLCRLGLHKFMVKYITKDAAHSVRNLMQLCDRCEDTHVMLPREKFGRCIYISEVWEDD